MSAHGGTCPLTQRQLVDEYFTEHRNQVLEIAAFLDRLDRSAGQNAADDFRLVAFRRALRELGSEEGGRVEKIQLLLSDHKSELLSRRDRQAAFGAPVRDGEAGRQCST
jgi:hypothetical protein